MRPDGVQMNAGNMVAVEFAPRQELRHRIQRWLAIIVLSQAALSLVVLGLLETPWLSFYRPDQDATVGLMASTALGWSLENSDERGVNVLLDDLARSSEVAFVEIRNGQGKVLYSRVVNQESWEKYRRHAEELAYKTGGVEVGANLLSSVLVHRVAIVPPVPDAAEEAKVSSATLVLGLRNLARDRALIGGLVSNLAAVVLMVILVLPNVRRQISRWTEGLRHLFQGIQRLAQGARPQPLAVTDNGEVSFLAVAFNEMAGKLVASQQALREANEHLERRVQARTQELAEAARKLDRMARRDELTGLANRRELVKVIDDYFSEAQRGGRELVCIMIDLDEFKSVNDTLGHQMGDKLLTLAAQTLGENCRGSDIAARLGGDEFVVLLPARNLEVARTVAQRMQEEFRKRVAELLQSANLPKLPSMSIGIATREGTGAGSAETLLHLADKALYQAKEAGKARIEVYAERAHAA